jgi:putative peptide zinc metalloprotease protein
MAVSAAGMYVELLIACAAAFTWWATHAGSLLHHLSFSLMIVCSVNTLVFNANPLMRFDGYFIFSDWLGIPNLAELSGKMLRHRCLRCLGIPAPDDRNLPPRRRRLLLAYGLLSFFYRWIVFAGSAYVLWLFLSPLKLGALVFILTAGTLLIYLVGPIFALLRALLRQGTFRRMKFARLALTSLGIASLTAVATLVPFPRHVEAVALVQADPSYLSRVTIPDPGAYLQSLAVRDGQFVEEGDVLAVLANPRLDIAVQLNEADQTLRAQQQRDLIALLAEATTADRASADWQLTEYELQSLQRQHQVLKLQQELLVLRAPRAGTILGLPSKDMVGQWRDKGTELCRIGSEHVLRAVFLVEPADQPQLRPGNSARLLVHGCGGFVSPGIVKDVAVVDARNIPPQLSSQTGGDVPSERDPLSGQVRPQQQRFLSTVHLTVDSRVLHPGAMGRIQIEVDSQTLWWRFQRFLARSFRWN